MKRKWGMRILFLAGFLLCCLPTAYSMIERQHQKNAVATYQRKAEAAGEKNLEAFLREAEAYNDMLYQSGGAVVDGMNTDILSDGSYNEKLDVSGTGIMGSLDIPKINVNLPIYHGTGDEALANGVGHLQGTSLPAGGENTHCVLSGHRGLPSSKLLVRLDEMKEGDLFFIRVCGETLAYRIYNIEVVEPGDTSFIAIQAGRDLTSIVTCTPYGINTHRLIVTGERVDYQEAQYEQITAEIPSIRELLLTFLPVIFLIMAIVLYIIDRRRMRRERNYSRKQSQKKFRH